MKTTGNTVLIIGGTSGIGEEFAVQLKQRGDTVLIAGRRQERLDELKAAHGFAGDTVDVTDAASITAFRDRVLAAHPEIDAVLISSGIMVPERWLEPGALEIAERTVETNLLGTIRTFAAFLPHLLAKPQATLLTVTSGLAYVPLALTPTYSATKSAVHAFTEATRAQLRGTSVQLVEIAPPLTRTGLMGPGTDNDQAMPLSAFVSESIALLQADPEVRQVLVERVKRQRFAEATGHYDAIFEAQAARR